MAKGIKGSTRSVLLVNCLDVSDATDAITSEADVRTARNGLLLLAKRGDTKFRNIGLFTSEATGFMAAGTAEATSKLTTLVQDTRNSKATVTMLSDSRVISDISTGGLYIFNVKNMRRYNVLQFDPLASDKLGNEEKLTAIIVGLDIQQAPDSDARSAYT